MAPPQVGIKPISARLKAGTTICLWGGGALHIAWAKWLKDRPILSAEASGGRVWRGFDQAPEPHVLRAASAPASGSFLIRHIHLALPAGQAPLGMFFQVLL